MLTYRSIFEIEDPDAYRRIVEPELHRWLSRKDHDLDSLSARWTQGKQSQALKVSAPNAHNRGEVIRITLAEDTGYTAVFTVDHAAHSATRVWIDVHSPQGENPAMPPRLVRNLIGQIEARDGAAVLTDAPLLYSSVDVPTLIEQINDEHRRAIVFVAGTAPELPLAKWKGFVSDLTRDTRGMAMVVVLDDVATRVFNEKARPNGYDVPPGTLRTYMPGAHLDDASDSYRNKVLSSQRLVEDRVPRLQRILAAATRRAVLPIPLDKSEKSSERLLSRVATDELLGLAPSNLPSTPPEGTPRVTPSSTPVLASKPPTKKVPASQVDLKATDYEVDLAGRTVRLVQRIWTDIWKRGPFTHDSLKVLQAALQEDPMSAAQGREQVRTLVEQQQDDLEAQESLVNELRRNLEEIDLELGVEKERCGELDAEVRRLRKQVAKMARDLPEVPHAELDQRVKPPASFAEIEERKEEFAHLRFTCDWDVVAELDEVVHAPLSRIAGVWEGLLALDDYARATTEGTFVGSFYDYLRNPPPGCAAIPRDRFASTESDTVQQQSRLKNQRVFPVPVEVDPSGSVVMLSHVKKGNSTTDPRVYVHDATASHGYVVIGSIGRHLDVKGTN